MRRFLAIPVLCLLSAGAAGAADVRGNPWKERDGWPTTRTLERPLPAIPTSTLPRLGDMDVANVLNGQSERFEVARFGNGVRVREANGCTWTRAGEWFAPSDSFARCGTSKNWHTARAQVAREGSLFPMRVGSAASYRREAVSWNGRTSSRVTRCEVTGTAEVLRPQGSATPAFVVNCDDGRVSRTTWYAPAEGPIAYREERKGRGVREAWVRID